MKITLENSGRNFNIGFQYDRENGITKAILSDMDSDLSFVGVSVLSPEDQFNKRIGRKVALSRLFKSYDYYFDYDLRADIWNSLRNRGMKLS